NLERTPTERRRRWFVVVGLTRASPATAFGGRGRCRSILRKPGFYCAKSRRSTRAALGTPPPFERFAPLRKLKIWNKSGGLVGSAYGIRTRVTAVRGPSVIGSPN